MVLKIIDAEKRFTEFKTLVNAYNDKIGRPLYSGEEIDYFNLTLNPKID
ncbi:hypothetical protein [Candidatus Phytoplasma tritici]|nr:hypothetical protein [Candidatus Phytoplasma tritici]